MNYERTCAREMNRQKLWSDIYTGLMVQRTALPLPMQQGEAERAADLALAAFDQRFPAPEPVIPEMLNEGEKLYSRALHRARGEDR